MATTAINALRYPGGTQDPPNGPLQIAQLAADLDTRLIPRFSNITARNAAITSPQIGMFCTVAGVLQEYAGGGWGPPLVAQFATAAARDTAIPGPQTGMKVIVGIFEQTYLNNAWRFSSSGLVSGVTDGNGSFAFAHGMGVTPSVPWFSLASGATDAINAITKPIISGKDGTNIYLTVYRTDTNAKLTNNPIFGYWGANY